MDMHKEVKEFSVLGHSIRLKDSDTEGSVSPKEIVDLVMGEAEEIRKSVPGLADSQIAVLIALKLAEEKLSIERDYKTNIASLQSTALDALKLVEEVSPTAH